MKFAFFWSLAGREIADSDTNFVPTNPAGNEDGKPVYARIYSIYIYVYSVCIYIYIEIDICIRTRYRG